MALSEREFNEIRGKILVNHQTYNELIDFLNIVSDMEFMLDETDRDDYFGSEGWRRKLGWEDH